MEKKKWLYLLISIVMDGVGYLSYLFPGVGEMTDIVWAPISTLVMLKMYGAKDGAAGSILQFAEEIIPGTDFIPSFVLTWVWTFFVSAKRKKQNQ